MNRADVLKAMVIDAAETIADIQREIERAKERLAIEERFIEELRRRQRQAERVMGEAVPTIKTGDSLNGDALTGDEPAIPEDKSIPQLIVTLLQSIGQPMRARDIAEEIGFDNPSVLSALGRRKDLFVSISRGIYKLRDLAEADASIPPRVAQKVQFGEKP